VVLQLLLLVLVPVSPRVVGVTVCEVGGAKARKKLEFGFRTRPGQPLTANMAPSWEA